MSTFQLILFFVLLFAVSGIAVCALLSRLRVKELEEENDALVDRVSSVHLDLMKLRRQLEEAKAHSYRVSKASEPNTTTHP